MKTKILTNIRFAQTAGIAQTLRAFLDFASKRSADSLEIVGVTITDSKRKTYRTQRRKNISIVSIGMEVPSIKDALEGVTSLTPVKRRYKEVIDAYRETIRREKPDVVLINGTYYMPWCLFLAAQKEQVPTVVHYHGVLTKETEGWPAATRKMFRAMERTFDRAGVYYIFPSAITKKVVEKDVFEHRVSKYSILPNPVPTQFFGPQGRGSKVNIGIVSRWSKVKNMEFCLELAAYNRQQGNKFVINIITDLNEKDPRYKALKDEITFHVPRGPRQLASFYRRMGVVISPSHFETYGNVSKEALASGTPALVSKNMGVSETFQKLGLQNWIQDFSSVEDIYHKIGEVIGKPVSRSVVSNVKKWYSPEKVFNELVDILLQQKVA